MSEPSPDLRRHTHLPDWNRFSRYCWDKIDTAAFILGAGQFAEARRMLAESVVDLINSKSQGESGGEAGAAGAAGDIDLTDPLAALRVPQELSALALQSRLLLAEISSVAEDSGATVRPQALTAIFYERYRSESTVFEKSQLLDLGFVLIRGVLDAVLESNLPPTEKNEVYKNKIEEALNIADMAAQIGRGLGDIALCSSKLIEFYKYALQAGTDPKEETIRLLRSSLSAICRINYNDISLNDDAHIALATSDIFRLAVRVAEQVCHKSSTGSAIRSKTALLSINAQIQELFDAKFMTLPISDDLNFELNSDPKQFSKGCWSCALHALKECLKKQEVIFGAYHPRLIGTYRQIISVARELDGDLDVALYNAINGALNGKISGKPNCGYSEQIRGCEERLNKIVAGLRPRAV